MYNICTKLQLLLNAETIRETDKKGRNILHYAAQNGRYVNFVKLP